jgi:hypothetical protein
LAEAFQLAQRALGELPAPVPHDKLRARMVALHGREDPLLSADRFDRLLRQANDAEVADVRKTGEDSYEVLPHRMQAAAQRERKAQAAPAPETPAAASAEATAASAAAESVAERSNRLAAVRFRRGSRTPARALADIPLVGVVKMEPEHHAPVVPEPAPVEKPEPRKGRGRGRKPAEPTVAPVKAAAKPRKGRKEAPEAPEASSAPEPAAEQEPAKKPARRGRRGGRGRGKPKQAPPS